MRRLCLYALTLAALLGWQGCVTIAPDTLASTIRRGDHDGAISALERGEDPNGDANVFCSGAPIHHAALAFV